MRPLLILAVAVAALVAITALFAGCEGSPAGDGDPDVAPPAPAVAPETSLKSTLAEMRQCENPVGGYTVGYPVAWHVHDGEVVDACSLFHPEPFDVPPASELPMEIAIAISVQPIPFDSVLTGDRGRRDLSRQPTRVDGRQAVRIDSETTGEGLYDAGVRYYHYLVDLREDGTLIAVTYDAGSPAFERRRAVLDAMMRTLRFPRVRLIIAPFRP